MEVATYYEGTNSQYNSLYRLFIFAFNNSMSKKRDQILTEKSTFLISEKYWQYAIVARPTNKYRTQTEAMSKQIADTIAALLGAYITASDITYRAPNFTIHLENHTYKGMHWLQQLCKQEISSWKWHHGQNNMNWTSYLGL